jgi:hypothetical protein
MGETPSFDGQNAASVALRLKSALYKTQEMILSEKNGSQSKDALQGGPTAVPASDRLANRDLKP